jgi:hypothetical protein
LRGWEGRHAHLVAAEVVVRVLLVVRVERVVADDVETFGRDRAPVTHQHLVQVLCE